MPHPRDYLQKAMLRIEEHINKNFITPTGIYPHFKELSKEERLTYYEGYTTHPDFEKVEEISDTFRLKPNRSASEALETLFSNNCIITLNNSSALVLGHYLALFNCMQAIHGDKKGKERFDAFFGSTGLNVSPQRRLTISSEGLLMGTHHLENEHKHFQSLSFILNVVHCEDEEEVKAKAGLGSVVFFMGDPDYDITHPWDDYEGYDCFVTSKSPFRVRSFSLGKHDYTLEKLTQLHCTHFAMDPVPDTDLMGEMALQRRLKPKADLDKIQGLQPYFLDFNERRLKCLLQDPIEDVNVQFNIYYQAEINHIEGKMLEDLSEKLSFIKENLEGRAIIESKIDYSFYLLGKRSFGEKAAITLLSANQNKTKREILERMVEKDPPRLFSDWKKR